MLLKAQHLHAAARAVARRPRSLLAATTPQAAVLPAYNAISCAVGIRAKQQINATAATMARKQSDSENSLDSKQQQGQQPGAAKQDEDDGYYPSIDQYRHVLKNMELKGIDKLEFYGTVKLHGTHGDVVQPSSGSTELRYQSKNRILSLGNNQDNNNFMRAMMEKDFSKLFDTIRSRVPNSDDQPIMLAGEWCGGNIQKDGIALQQLERMFVIFDIKVGSRWVDFRQFGDIHDNIQRIYNVMQFPTWTIEIDRADPETARHRMIQITNEVGAECPAAKFLGVSGKGEGVVWKSASDEHNYARFWFKLKTEEYSLDKPKKRKPQLAATEPEKMMFKEFLFRMVSDNRIRQGMQVMEEAGKAGELVPLAWWIANDIVKEEHDTIKENGWDAKRVQRNLVSAITGHFMKFGAVPMEGEI